MRILATDAAGGQIIVSMSKDELANLAGYYSAYGMKNTSDGFKSGENVNLGPMYEKAAEILAMHKEAKDAAEKLRKASVLFLSCFDGEK